MFWKTESPSFIVAVLLAASLGGGEAAAQAGNAALIDDIVGLRPGMSYDEVAAALQARSDQTIPGALSETSPPAHGLQRVKDGFDIEEVVAEYNILRGCIHDLAQAEGLTLQGKPFHILNRVLDGAIGLALQTFAAQRALEVRQRREEYLSFVAHDLRTPLNAILLATNVLELALPAPAAKAAHAQMLRTLQRNVRHLDSLVCKVIEENTSLLAELGIKLERRALDLWPLVEGLVHDLRPIAHDAGARLDNQVPDDLVVYADAALLRRVFQNVVANAIEYTPHGEVLIGARQLGAERGLDLAHPREADEQVVVVHRLALAERVETAALVAPQKGERFFFGCKNNSDHRTLRGDVGKNGAPK